MVKLWTIPICTAALFAANLLAAPAALAVTCTTDPQDQVEGYDSASSTQLLVQGTKATFGTPNFSQTQQCGSVRSVAVVSSAIFSTDFMELGWVTQNSATSHTLFEAWKVDGVTHQNPDPPNAGNPASGTTHTYWISNANGNSSWAFNYDGTYLESKTDSGMTSGAYPLTNSERHYGGDDLNAHFTNLSECTVTGTCSYHSWVTLSVYRNTTARWVFCKVSNSEHYVRLDTCP